MIYFLFLLLLLSINVNAKEVLFKWDKIKKAQKYKVHICKDIKCKKISFSFTTNKPEFKKDIIPGYYYFSVAPISKTGKVGFFTKVKRFSIPPPKPEYLNPRDGDIIQIDAIKPIRFTWHSVKYASSYTIELILPDGKIKKFETKRTSVSIRLRKLGKYKWKLRSNIKRKLTKGFTDSQEFTLEKVPPYITNIGNNSVIPILSDNLQINWQGTDYGNYLIYIDYKRNQEEQYFRLVQKRTKENSITIFPFEKGFYRVKLAGYYNKKRIVSKDLYFEAIKRNIPNIRLALFTVNGAPYSSLTSTSIDSTYNNLQETNNSPGTIPIYGISIEHIPSYLFNSKKVMLNFSYAAAKEHQYFPKIAFWKIGIRHFFDFWHFMFAPIIGYHNGIIESITPPESGGSFDNFKYTRPWAQLYFGIGIEYYPPLLRRFTIKSEFNWIGLYKERYVYEWDSVLEFLLFKNCSIGIGYYYYDLLNLKEMIDTNTNQAIEGTRNSHEKYKGLKLLLGFQY